MWISHADVTSGIKVYQLLHCGILVRTGKILPLTLRIINKQKEETWEISRRKYLFVQKTKITLMSHARWKMREFREIDTLTFRRMNLPTQNRNTIRKYDILRAFCIFFNFLNLLYLYHKIINSESIAAYLY